MKFRVCGGALPHQSCSPSVSWYSVPFAGLRWSSRTRGYQVLGHISVWMHTMPEDFCEVFFYYLCFHFFFALSSLCFDSCMLFSIDIEITSLQQETSKWPYWSPRKDPIAVIVISVGIGSGCVVNARFSIPSQMFLSCIPYRPLFSSCQQLKGSVQVTRA